MQVTSSNVLPVLMSVDDRRYNPEEYVLDWFVDSLAVAYAVGPPAGGQFVRWSDLARVNADEEGLRRAAFDNLYYHLPRVRIHGEPPALMLSFGGLEASVLLADEFWDNLEGRVPGDLVVAAPARDVVIITGSQSRAGLEKARRAAERVFFASDQHLLSRELFVRRYRQWEPIRPVSAQPHTRRASGRAH